MITRTLLAAGLSLACLTFAPSAEAQSRNSIEITQSGHANELAARVNGYRNRVNLEQRGVRQFISTLQEGARNGAQVSQYGAGNEAGLNQQGRRNRIVMGQEGRRQGTAPSHRCFGHIGYHTGSRSTMHRTSDKFNACMLSCQHAHSGDP